VFRGGGRICRGIARIPHQDVVLGTTRACALFVSAITVVEMLYGIARMANGIRQPAGLRELAALMFEEGFAVGILPFDTDAAVRYAGLAAESEAKGKVVDMADGQIAALHNEN